MADDLKPWERASKAKPQTEATPWEVAESKKKIQSPELDGGSIPLPNGSTQAIKPNKLSDQLKEYDSAYGQSHTPSDNQAIDQAKSKPKKETLQGDKTFMDKVKLGSKLLSSSLAKGALSLLEGGQYVADKSAAIPSISGAIQNPVMDAKISSLHKDAEMGLNPEFHGRNAVEKFANTLVETAPALATSEFGGFFLSGLGNAHSEVQKMKENGVQFKNGSDDLYVLMNGVANELAMKELPVAKYLSKAPKPLRDAVVSKMSLGALEKIANSGEKITAENLMKPLAEEARSVSDKIMQGGVNFLKSYAKTEGVLGGLTISNAIAKKLSDKLSGSDNFDPSSGDLVEGIKNTFGESLGFSLFGTAVQGLTDPGALMRKTPIHTEVLKSLRSDPSDANAEQIRTDLQNHGQEQGWSPEQIGNSVQALNTIHDAVKAIPKTFGEAKFNKAVELITGRKDLEARMAEIKASKASNDESIRDVPTKEESLVQAKLDQSNDKLKELATDHKFRYNFDEEKGTYTKQLGENGKAEEITKDRYELEQLEKEYKKPKVEEPVVEPSSEKSEVSRIIEPPKPIQEMNSEEMYSYATDVRKALKQQDKEFQDKTEQEKEDSGYYDIIDDVEDLRDASQRIGFIESSENADELASSVRSALANIKSGEMSEYDLSILNAAKNKAKELNVNPEDLIKDVLKKVADRYNDPDDAELMVKTTLEKILPQPEESNIPIEQIGESKKIGNGKESETKASQDNGLDKATGSVDNIQTEESINGSTAGDAGRLPSDTAVTEEVTGIKNEVTKAERAKRGEDEVEVLARRTLKDSFDKGKEMVDTGEIDPRSLAEALSKKPRALNAEESAALIYDRMRLSNEHERIMNEIDKASKEGNDDLEGELRQRLSNIEKATEINDEAARRTGYEQGLGLAVRRLLIKKDYSLDRLIQKARLANEGKELPADVRKRLEDYADKLKDADKKLSDYEKKVASLEAERKLSKLRRETEHENRKERRSVKREDIVKEREGLFDELKKIARQQAGTLNSGINPEMLPIIAKIAKSYVSEGIVKLEDIVDGIYENLKDHVEGLDKEDIIAAINDSEQQKKQDKNLKATKSRQLNREQELTRQLETKDFTPKPKFKTQYDQEANDNKARIEKLKRKVDAEIYALKRNNRSKTEKTLDYINAWRRAALLSRVSTLFKLGSAATERIITTPLEEGIGGIIAKIPGLSKIAKNAPREGSPNIKAEAKALTETFSKKALEDVAETIKNGHGSLDYAHGKHLYVQNGGFEGIMDIPGKVHQAIKVIPKRNEFFRSYEKRMAHAIKSGLDPEAPLVRDAVAADAYLDANRSIFMNDNLMTDAYRHMINALENTKDPNIKDRNKIAASIARFLLPIVKVPTNFALETSNYAVGAARALPKIIKAVTQGADSLTPEQSDFVLRALKKNSIGLAFMALGYYNPNAIGGYYQDGEKRKKDDAQVGDVNVYGVHLPHFLLHAPALEAMQLGATFRRVRDKYERKHKGQSGTFAGTVAAGEGVSGQIPFFDTPNRISDAMKSSKAADYYLGETAKSFIVPGIVQEVAEDSDKDTKSKLSEHPIDYILAKPVKRKPSTFMEHLKTGVPGLRQTVKKK